MAALGVLLAIAALAGQAAAGCPENDIQCANGICLNRGWMCDGVNDCHDGIDEASCPVGASASLRVGDSVVAKANVEIRHNSIFILACNATQCGSAQVGQLDDGSLSYWLRSGCQWPLWQECASEGPEPDWNSLTAGAYSLVLERRASQLAVWDAEHPDNVGLIEAPEGELVVRARSWFSNHDFAAVFEEPATTSAVPSTDAPTEAPTDAPTEAPTEAPSTSAP